MRHLAIALGVILSETCIGRFCNAAPVKMEDGLVKRSRFPDYFEFEAHRGGAGENLEESVYSFGQALDYGVTALEMDIHITKDGIPIVWHDPTFDSSKCVDTKPAKKGDKDFPYLGKNIMYLTWEQVATINCNVTPIQFPYQKKHKESRVLKLHEVFDLAKKDPNVRFDIETKRDYTMPEETPSAKTFADKILDVVEEYGLSKKVTIESFDWSTIPYAKERNKDVSLSLLYSFDSFYPNSPANGPIDWDEVKGDLVAAAKKIGANIISPDTTLPDVLDIEGGAPALVRRAHAYDVKVLPWTVDSVHDMNYWIDAGADGIITNYPGKLKNLLLARGIKWRKDK